MGCYTGGLLVVVVVVVVVVVGTALLNQTVSWPGQSGRRGYSTVLIPSRHQRGPHCPGRRVLPRSSSWRFWNGVQKWRGGIPGACDVRRCRPVVVVEDEEGGKGREVRGCIWWW